MLVVAFHIGNWMGWGGAQPNEDSSVLLCINGICFWGALMALLYASDLSDMVIADYFLNE